MYMHSECEAVCKEYSKMVKNRSRRATKIWGYIFVGYLFIMITLLFVPNLLDSDDAIELYVILGGFAFVGLTIALGLSVFMISEIPAFEYLYREIYTKLNQERGTFYKYEAFEKDKFEFNKRGGIFPRLCQIEAKRHVTGTTSAKNEFDIFDVNCVTGTGKHRHEHFRGIYFIVKQKNSSLFQVRSDSRPHLKGVKFMRIKDTSNFKVYLDATKHMSNTEYKYIETVTRLKRNLKAKKVYLSITSDEIHFGYVPKVQIRKQYDLSVKRLNALYPQAKRHLILGVGHTPAINIGEEFLSLVHQFLNEE